MPYGRLEADAAGPDVVYFWFILGQWNPALLGVSCVSGICRQLVKHIAARCGFNHTVFAVTGLLGGGYLFA